MAPGVECWRSWLRVAGTLVLLAGFSVAGWIFFHAADERSDVIAYEMVDGLPLPITTADSKAYRRELERFGGKASLVLDDLSRWYSGLWRGKRLAFTLAALTIALGVFCFWLADREQAPPSKGR